MLYFLLIWFFSSCSSFLALRLHAKIELGENYSANDDLMCFVFALFLGPIPLLMVFGINLWYLIKE